MKRTTITLVVLSEETIHERMDIGDVMRECDQGDFVLSSDHRSEEDLTDDEMGRALWEAGSEPGFFQLDEA